jgi:hypothetical protein
MATFDQAWLSGRETPSPLKATPLYLVDDMASAKRRFSAMGFELTTLQPTVQNSEFGDVLNDGCVGMSAGQTQIILIEETHAKRTMPPEVLPSFKHGPALYVWVDSVDETRSKIADPVIAEMVTGYGTWELFVESRIGLIIFAEKLSQEMKMAS